MLSGSLNGRRVWGRMDTCVCMIESLDCSPEAVTVLLMGYTPRQNKKKTLSTVPLLYSRSLFLHAMLCLVAQLCLTLRHPIDCSMPGSSTWEFSRHVNYASHNCEERGSRAALLSSKGSSQPRDRTQVSHIAGRFFTV